MEKYLLIPLEDTVVFPDMTVTLPLDTGDEDRVSWCRATKACTPRSARSPRSSRPRGCPAARRLRR